MHLQDNSSNLLPPQSNPHPAPAEAPWDGSEHVLVSVTPLMRVRDAIVAMNEVFATTAAVIDSQGRFVGWLSQSLLVEHLARDADWALKSPCYALLADVEDRIAA